MQNDVYNKLVELNQFVDNEFTQKNFVDIHCHCLFGIDDGPATISQSLALCRALVDDGITSVIATPHQLGRYSQCNEASQVRQAVSVINTELMSHGIPLRITPGGDVRVDERICQLIEADKILTLADGGKYILLELPHDVLIDIKPLLVDLASMGILAILSHPERHAGLTKNPDILNVWLDCPSFLQITAGSLLGYFGPNAEEFGWQLLSSGQACLVATDSHNLDGRRPCMAKAFEKICDRIGEKTARLVCIDNPLKILRSQDITTCPANKVECVG